MDVLYIVTSLTMSNKNLLGICIQVLHINNCGKWWLSSRTLDAFRLLPIKFTFYAWFLGWNTWTCSYTCIYKCSCRHLYWKSFIGYSYERKWLYVYLQSLDAGIHSSWRQIFVKYMYLQSWKNSKMGEREFLEPTDTCMYKEF